jgi:hypothetical protein
VSFLDLLICSICLRIVVLGDLLLPDPTYLVSFVLFVCSFSTFPAHGKIIILDLVIRNIKYAVILCRSFSDLEVIWFQVLSIRKECACFNNFFFVHT